MKKLILLFISLMLIGCSLPGLGGSIKDNDIIIASGDTSERQILAEISLQMINHYHPEIKVNLVNNLGTTLLILQTLINKDANVASAMYTGTSLTGELNLEPTTNAKLALSQVIDGYYHKYDMVWLPSFGFENSYAFMVREDFALKFNLSRVSDLKDLADDLIAGVDTSWIDRHGDGYNDFKEIYGFDFNKVYPMQIGLVYQAVSLKEMDVVLGYSSDGRIAANNLVVLEDDLNLFPPYDASPVITVDILLRYPQLLETFLRLENSISNTEIQELNRLSDADKIEAKVIAKQFLEEHNYFEDIKLSDTYSNEDYQSIIEDINKRLEESESQ